MNGFRSIAATIVARVDRMVATFENHEAVVDVALSRMETALRTAQVRLRRVVQDGQTLEQRSQEARERADVWRSRARQVQEDEQKALACVQRMEAAARDQSAFLGHLKHHRAIETQLRAEIALMERRLEELRRQRNILRTRASKAEVARDMSRIDSQLCGDLDEALALWEDQLSQMEGVTFSNEDELASEFEKREEQLRLRKLLDEIRAQPAE